MLLVIQPRRGARSFELVIIGVVAIIAIGFMFGVPVGPLIQAELPSACYRSSKTLARCCLQPQSSVRQCMPHAIYAHSALASLHRGLARRRYWICVGGA